MKTQRFLLGILICLVVCQSTYAARQKIFVSSKPPINAMAGGEYYLAANATSGLPVVFSTGSPSVCYIDGSVVHFTGPGTAIIYFDQPGDFEYAAAPRVTQTFTVGGIQSQTISFNLSAGASFGGSATLTATASSGLPVTYSGTNVAISGNVAYFNNVGTATITATQAGNSSYAPAPSVTRIVTVTPAQQTISFQPLAAAPVVGQTQTLVATSSSGLPVTYSTSTPGTVILLGNVATFAAAGAASITAAQPGNSNFYPALSQTITVEVPRMAQAIAFSLPATFYVGQTYSLSAWASSELPVSFSTSTPSVVYLSGNLATFTNAGTAYIQAIQSGGSQYLTASTTGTATVYPSMGLMMAEEDLPKNENTRVAFYPIPANENLTIRLPKPAEDVFPFNVYNTLGSRVSMDKFEKGEQVKSIRTVELPAGVYILRIANPDGVTQERFIISH